MICVVLCCSQQITLAQVSTTINRGNGAEPDSLNPHLAQGLNSHNILLDLYEGLITFDVNGQPTYGVALSHRANDNHTVWDFNLNPKAKWSDGEPVTTDDFIFAWKTAYEPTTAAPYRHLLDNLVQDDEIQLSSENKWHLRIQLSKPDSGLLNKLALPIFFPLPKHSNQKQISNGAYYLTEWRIQEKAVLKKNPHFHQASEVRTENINYWVTENQNSELLRFRAGELDITETIPDSKTTWLKAHLKDELRIAPYYGTFFLGLNLNDRQLANAHLRQALSLSIDRRILVDKVLKSGQVPANQIIPITNYSNVPDQGFNLELAQSALQKSGFKTATDRLEILYNNSQNQKKVALAVAAMWRQNLGIRSQLKNQEWKVFVKTRKTQNKQVFRSGWIADFHDPLNFLTLFHSQSPFNFYGFNDAAYDATIDQLRMSSVEEKHKYITQAEQILQSEIPVIPLYHYVSRHLVNTQIGGFMDNPMDRHLSRYLFKKND